MTIKFKLSLDKAVTAIWRDPATAGKSAEADNKQPDYKFNDRINPRRRILL